MNKRVIPIFLFLMLIPFALSLEDNSSEENNSDLNRTLREIADDLKDSSNEANPWNETTTISPVWQKLIGGFFGLNLKGESTEISAKEAMVFLLVFLLFFTIIYDILKMTPLFKKAVFGISQNFIASIIITSLVSITGAFINLKNFFVNGIRDLILTLDLDILNFMIENKFWGIILTMFIIIPLIIIIHEVISWINPIIKKFSEVSRAEAKGRQLGEVIESNQIPSQ